MVAQAMTGKTNSAPPQVDNPDAPINPNPAATQGGSPDMAGMMAMAGNMMSGFGGGGNPIASIMSMFRRWRR